jgi:transcriptional regulator with XRE-family HTH domain
MQQFRYKKFGALVRECRQSLQPPMTQRHLAGLLGVTNGYLTHIETGRTLPSLRTMATISRVLGIPLTELLRASGHLAGDATSGDDGNHIPSDRELNLFFRDDWQELTAEERELLRDFVRMLKTRLKRRRQNATPPTVNESR